MRSAITSTIASSSATPTPARPRRLRARGSGRGDVGKSAGSAEAMSKSITLSTAVGGCRIRLRCAPTAEGTSSHRPSGILDLWLTLRGLTMGARWTTTPTLCGAQLGGIIPPHRRHCNRLVPPRRVGAAMRKYEMGDLAILTWTAPRSGPVTRARSRSVSLSNLTRPLPFTSYQRFRFSRGWARTAGGARTFRELVSASGSAES
jgi:hypothetical protein